MRNTTKFSFYFLFVILAFPFYAHAFKFNEKNCTKLGDQLVPLDFIVYIEEELYHDPELQAYGIEFDNKAGDGWHQNSERILSYPDLQNRIEDWRMNQGMSPFFEEECAIPSPPDEQGRMSDTPKAAAEEAPGKPQHSVADSIFRKKTIKLQIFENGGFFDVDVVQILWNGELINSNLILTRYPGYTLTLELSPSALLESKANILSIRAIDGGTSVFEPRATVGINVSDPGLIFKDGPGIKPFPSAFYVAIEEGSTSPDIKLALGLACMESRWPQSREHAKEALGSKPTNDQPGNRPRIVTVDRDRPGDKRATKRRKKSQKFYKDNGGAPASPGQELDEYPQAVFKENAGRAHVKPISKGDNRGSGSAIGKFITGPPGRMPYTETGTKSKSSFLTTDSIVGMLFRRYENAYKPIQFFSSQWSRLCLRTSVIGLLR